MWKRKWNNLRLTELLPNFKNILMFWGYVANLTKASTILKYISSSSDQSKMIILVRRKRRND